MPRRRDRHARGLRGPLALPNPLGVRIATPPRPPDRTTWFAEAVGASVARIGDHCPQALDGVRVGIEEVPLLNTAWSGDRVPLAAAVEAADGAPRQLVVYRRPLEHRATDRQDLRDLVHRTIVEQLAALTGLTTAAIDPDLDEQA